MQALVSHYSDLGFEVEYVLRYKPAASAGDVPGFVAFVRDVVHRYARYGRLVAYQVTNEVNFGVSADSSDGVFAGAEDAIIQGVEAARTQATADGRADLQVGFNWFYRTTPSQEQAFWSYLGAHGGPAFVKALGWVGLDAYPGTFFPPTPGTEAGSVENALSEMRRCYLPLAGIPDRTAIHVQENGWPTNQARTPALQEAALRSMVNAFDLLRVKYHVTDYRWFDLRDADSSSPNFQQQFGIMFDNYTPKPAFGAYRDLVGGLGARAPLPPALVATTPARAAPVAAAGSQLPPTRAVRLGSVAALLGTVALGLVVVGVLVLRALRRLVVIA
jgi:hypothetical protein